MILTPHVKSALKKLESDFSNIKASEYSDYVWSMWWQEDVPEMIQMCLDSIKKYHPNVIVITEKNYKDYVDIPDYILDKFYSGIIPPPHFSDYIRMALLDKYGGTWIDASCFMLMPVPKFIKNQEFFVLKRRGGEMFTNYFIHSFKGCIFTKAIRLCLEQYWENEKNIYGYGFFVILVSIIIDLNSKCSQIYKNIIFDIEERTKLITFLSPLTSFNPDIWDYLQKVSFMYKLSRKSGDGNKEKGFIEYLLTQWRESKEKNISEV